KTRLQLKGADAEDKCDVKDILVPLLKEKYIESSCRTAFLSVVTAGFGLLTAMAIFTLYVYVHKMNFSTFAYTGLIKNLSIVGGAYAVGGLLAIGVQAIISTCNSN